MKIDELFKSITYRNKRNLIDKISTLIMKRESKLSKRRIIQDIDLRNKLGEGIMSPRVLSIHVQDTLVEKDTVFYINLNSDFSYFSITLNKKFNIKKLVVIVVNPTHQLDHLSKLEKFIRS